MPVSGHEAILPTMEVGVSKFQAQATQEARPKGRLRPAARNCFLVIALLVFLFLVFFFFNFQQVVVVGASMEPTFEDGQRILVCKALWLVGPVKKGDVVVIRFGAPGEYLVKRVAWVEGEGVDVSIPPPDQWDFFRQGRPYVVPSGQVYVLGDNLAASEDSRSFGPVPLKDVIGKVWGSE